MSFLGNDLPVFMVSDQKVSCWLGWWI